jgi:hypothetical protein
MKIIIKQVFHPAVNSSALDESIYLITPFYNTFSLCSSVKLEGKILHPYATSGIIIILPSKGHPNNVLFADQKKQK